MSFAGKTVLISGAASGMGLLAAQCYAKEGANIVMVDINEAALKEKSAEIAAYPANVLPVCIDITDYKQVESARDQAVARFGSIDILLNMAGGAETRICKQSGEFHEIPIEVYDFSIDMNLKGAIYFDHAVMAQMAKQNSGVIIHMGSITGLEGSSNNIGYATCKSALMNGTTTAVAQAGLKHNVRCLCVAPGPVLTRAAMAKMVTPMGRAAEPQEIVDMIMYATSDKAAFMTGTTILMDGGRHLMLP